MLYKKFTTTPTMKDGSVAEVDGFSAEEALIGYIVSSS